MKKIKDFFKKRTFVEIILVIIAVLFIILLFYLGILTSHLSIISSNFDRIVHCSSCTRGRTCSQSCWLSIDGSVGATIDGSIDIDNTYGNSLKIEQW